MPRDKTGVIRQNLSLLLVYNFPWLGYSYVTMNTAFAVGSLNWGVTCFVSNFLLNVGYMNSMLEIWIFLKFQLETVESK